MRKKTRKTRARVTMAAGMVLAAGAANANFVDGPEGIGDLVWVDTNMNGQQDVGELGLPGVTVNLLDGSENFLGSQITNGNGNYLFLFDAGDQGIPYKIQFELPTGYAFTIQDAVGVTDILDSDADPTTGISSYIYYSESGSKVYDVDAGMYVVPVPAAIWLFGSGLLGLIGISKRKTT